MYVIKLERDKSLIQTIQSDLFEGEYGLESILFLIPKKYDDIDVANCDLCCRYIVDGQIHQEILGRSNDHYNADLYQYTMPISEDMTSVPGKIELWLELCARDGGAILKTYTTTIPVHSVI